MQPREGATDRGSNDGRQRCGHAAEGLSLLAGAGPLDIMPVFVGQASWRSTTLASAAAHRGPLRRGLCRTSIDFSVADSALRPSAEESGIGGAVLTRVGQGLLQTFST